MTNIKSNVLMTVLIVTAATLVGNSHSLLAQNTTPPSDISSYISSRKSTASKIVSDLKSDKELPSKWPHAHTDKILSAAEKLSSKYKDSGKPGQGADTARTWADWVAKEILLWGHIEKDFRTFGQLHNQIININKRTKKEIEDTQKLIQDFRAPVRNLEELLNQLKEMTIGLDKFKRDLKPWIVAYKCAVMFEGGVPPDPADYIKTLSPKETKYANAQLDAVLTQLVDGFQRKLRSSSAIHLSNVFLREIPYKLANLKKQTDLKYSTMKKFKDDSASAVKRELVKYSGLKRTADVTFYRSLDKDCDTALSDQFSRTEKAFRVDWEAMLQDWTSYCYGSHPYIKQKLKSDFSNADDVLDEIEEAEAQITSLEKYKELFDKALKENDIE